MSGLRPNKRQLSNDSWLLLSKRRMHVTEVLPDAHLREVPVSPTLPIVPGGDSAVPRSADQDHICQVEVGHWPLVYPEQS